MNWNNIDPYNQQMNNWPNQSNMQNQPKPITLNTLPVNNQNNSQGMPQCIPGRVVHDSSEIAPNEVPMDNTYATFIRDDYKEIYMKTWSSDGTQINTLRFVLVDDQISQDNKQAYMPDLNPVLERLDRIEKKVNGIRYHKPKGGNKDV